MPRKPRILSSTGIYHIILRSVNQHIIFEEESDFQKFLFILSDCKEKYGIDIFAYCLMDNHIHLLIQSPFNIMPSFFNSLETRFVRWYNNKYSRSGHLFQERYHSIPIEITEYYLQVLVYIHYNPVKANVCRYPSEYRWSSFNAFYGAKNSLVNINHSYVLAGSKQALLYYFASKYNSPDPAQFIGIHGETRHFLTDEAALQLFKKVTHLSSTSAVTDLNKKTRNEYVRLLRTNGLNLKQIARVMDISETTAKRILKMTP